MTAGKLVSKAEFDAFLAAYPNTLESRVTNFCEPPVLGYYDNSTHKQWPENMVARVVLYETFSKDPKDASHTWEPNKHFILESTA